MRAALAGGTIAIGIASLGGVATAAAYRVAGDAGAATALLVTAVSLLLLGGLGVLASAGRSGPTQRRWAR